MIIGLTGGIGSGKSTVSEILRKENYYIIDADVIYKDLTKPGMPLVDKLEKEFGDVITNGELDRVKLSKLALGNPKLNEITHKAISEEIEKQISNNAEKNIILDLPLLFESGYDKRCDEIWVVTASEDIRLERILKRNGMPYEEAKRRIKLQMSEEEKIKNADVVIFNEGSIEELVKKVKELLNGRS